MIIKRLTKVKESTYEVEIEDKTYVFDEETVLKYRLFKGYEIGKEELQECIETNEMETIKKKAYSYYLRYQKNSHDIVEYLKERNIPYYQAKEAVEALREKGLLDDLGLAVNIACSLARNSNGVYMIRYKLKNKHFSDGIITEALNQIPEEDMEEGKSKLLAKSLKKYGKLSSFEQKQKLREVFYRHGYG
ncbi:MAG: RecX family transcriptional regulator, partial [Anaeroplasmataceae bacterium]|nr:RecX family transcriptional regulator [Anaeroplasmataceae bacterium]